MDALEKFKKTIETIKTDIAIKNNNIKELKKELEDEFGVIDYLDINTTIDAIEESLDGLKRDREQLLAEAVVIYKKGEVLTLPYELVRQSEDEAMKRLADDPWQFIIAEWAAANPDTIEVSTQHIYRNVLGGNVQTMHTGHQRRIALSLKNLGWVKRQTLKGLIYVRIKKVVAE